MYLIECEGCDYDGQGHCFFWGLEVSCVTDWECTYAKGRQA